MRFFLSSYWVGLQTQPKKARRISKAGPFCHTLRESRHGQADSFRQEMAEEDIGATGRTKQAVGRNRQLSENDIIHSSYIRFLHQAWLHVNSESVKKRNSDAVSKAICCQWDLL